MGDKYVFLDRDGVINKDPAGWTEYNYVTRREDFHFLPGVLDAMKKFADNGYKCVIISNQQGVGKGYFTEEDLADVTEYMTGEIKAAGGDIAGIFYCIHRKDEDCDCRKPRNGLFQKAGRELGIGGIEGKYYIGDTERDMQAGRDTGLKTIFVLSGKYSREDAEKWEYKPDYVCDDLLAAAKMILGEA